MRAVIKPRDAELQNARKAAARGWSAWLDMVLTEIERARETENEGYAVELVALMEQLSAAITIARAKQHG